MTFFPLPFPCRQIDRARPIKKPAGAYRASGPMSAIRIALLRLPRARPYTGVMMVVAMRAKSHDAK
jgi:hypothetical protein